MDNIKMAARAAVMVVGLVFVVAVAGASADGVRGTKGGDALIHFSTFQTSFSSVHSDWNFDWNSGTERFDGIRGGYWLKDADYTSNDSSWCSPDPTAASPEPGTLLLLAIGMAGLFFMGRRNAFQE
jgi:hypothetical protein